MTNKIDFTDLTQPNVEMTTYFASLILSSISKLVTILRLTEYELLKGSLWVTESVVSYLVHLGSISKERAEEARQEVRKQSEENYKKMKESGQLEYIRNLMNANKKSSE